jgi:hypothetical protein
MREMRHLQSKVPQQNCFIMAGSTVEDFESILTRVSPRILQFSGRCSGSSRSLLIFEKNPNPNPYPNPPTPTLRQFVATSSTSHIAVICWSTPPSPSLTSVLDTCAKVALSNDAEDKDKNKDDKKP